MGLTEMLAAAKEREANAGSMSAAAAAPAPAASVVAEAEAQAREVREGAADADRLKKLLGGSGGKSAGMALNAFAGGRASMAGLASKTRQVTYEPPARTAALPCARGPGFHGGRGRWTGATKEKRPLVAMDCAR